MTDRPVILAGAQSLTPENVKDALEAVHPYAVDVASGVEAAPGVKDHAKLKAFIRTVPRVGFGTGINSSSTR